MKKLRVVATFIILTILGSVILASSAGAMLIRVSQESSPTANDFDSNVLGWINPFASGGLSSTQFYNYNTPFNASYGGNTVGGPSALMNASQLFLVDATDGLSLFVVHDMPNDGSGGSTETRWTISNDIFAELLIDDPNDPRDSGVISGGGTQYDSENEWNNCCTDGYVLGTLESDWILYGQFLAQDFGTELVPPWIATDAGGNNITLALDIGREVRLDTVQPVPEPMTMILLGTGLVGVAATGRLRRRKK